MAIVDGRLLRAAVEQVRLWSAAATRMRFPLIDHIRAKLRYYLSDLNPLAALLCFAIFAALFFGTTFLRTRRRPERRDWLYGLLLCLYGTAVVSITLLGRDSGAFRSQPDPFASFNSLLSGAENSTVDTLLNVVLFIPLGILLLFRLRVPWACGLILAATLSIETLQLLTNRGLFEVLDLLANCLGGEIGIGLFFAGRAIKRWIQRRSGQTGPREAPGAETNAPEQGDR